MSFTNSGRYVTLDGMRGVAALAVAAYHLNDTLAPNGYLAVDFFFALSGFVLAIAYTNRLRADTSVLRFLQARIVRLYPLFLAGIALGAAHRLQLLARGGGSDLGISGLAHATFFGALMLPDPFHSFLYPINEVFWSIFAEILVNIAFAVFLIRIPARALRVATLASGAILCLASYRIGSANGGAQWDTADVGLIRTVFSFCVGMVVANMTVGGIRPNSTSSVLFIACLLAPILMTVDAENQILLDLFAIIAIFPIIIFFGSRVEPPTWLTRPFVFLGDISYALYASHWPIAVMTIAVVKRLDISYLTALPFYLATTVSVAFALTRFWDVPIRSYINRKLLLRRTAKAHDARTARFVKGRSLPS